MMVTHKVYIIILMLVNLLSMHCRSVGHRKEKDQATFDKEVLLEDDDYDEDDVLNLTAEEQKERLKMLVEKKIDTNHDGFVDLEELQNWTLKAFDSFENDDTIEEFRMVDTNKDGLISWDEFEEDMFGEDFAVDDADKKTVQQFLKEKKMYSAADLDKDSLLSLSEFMIFRIPRGHPLTKEVAINDALENYDTNSDGAISLDEFLMETNHDPADHDFIASESDRFKDEFDLNEDGLLDGEEILSWIEPDNKEDANDEADHLMSECDSNNDNKLSVEEIVNNHNLWVESDATDYGKQLLFNHDEF